MPSTIAHALFPSVCTVASKKGFPPLSRAQWIRFVILAVFLGNSPDLDLIPASLWPHEWYSIHRFWGHNIFSVTLLIMAGQWLLRRFVSPAISRARAYFTCTLLVVSHLFLDAMGHRTSYGGRPEIPLFFPKSDWAFSLPFELFPIIELKKTAHPLAAHVFARDFWVHVIFHEVFFALLLAGIYFVVFSSCRAVLKWYEKRGRAPQEPLAATEASPSINRAA